MRRGERELPQRTVRHRVEKVIFLAEVPVDACHADAKMLTEQGHAQVVDGYLVRKLERAVDDVVRIDRPAFASLTFVSGCLACHGGLPPSCQPVNDTGD